METGSVPGGEEDTDRQLLDVMAAFVGTGTGLRSYIYDHNPEKPESHGCQGEQFVNVFSSFIAGASLYILLIKKI